MLNFRPLERDDLDWFFSLNEACVPEVNSLPLEELSRMISIADYAKLVEEEGERLGAALAFAPKADYASQNFLWFRERYADFLYLDRIMVTEAARGRGAGKRLHEDLFNYAVGRTERITCEVNEIPPNPASLAFHRNAGFEIVGRQKTEGGSKSVALMTRPL